MLKVRSVIRLKILISYLFLDNDKPIRNKANFDSYIFDSEALFYQIDLYLWSNIYIIQKFCSIAD